MTKDPYGLGASLKTHSGVEPHPLATGSAKGVEGCSPIKVKDPETKHAEYR